jgi:alkanesulfonate monooxygenase SsuD/methylene tetrahydromethanopterin reductase-like flavin-dependent oxidoreductase (luciferase family)
MKAVWTHETAEYRGAHVNFAPIQQWPKPVQAPSVPVLIGGEGPRAVDRVVAYGDGWIPNDHPELLERVALLAEIAGAAGRESPPVTVYAMPRNPPLVAAYAAAGVNRLVFNLPAVEWRETHAILDEIDALTMPYRTDQR